MGFEVGSVTEIKKRDGMMEWDERYPDSCSASVNSKRKTRRSEDGESDGFKRVSRWTEPSQKESSQAGRNGVAKWAKVFGRFNTILVWMPTGFYGIFFKKNSCFSLFC